MIHPFGWGRHDAPPAPAVPTPAPTPAPLPAAQPNDWQEKFNNTLEAHTEAQYTNLSPPTILQEPTTMSTTAIPLATAATLAAAKTENGFERFIDKIKGVFQKAKPILDEGLKVAQEAEPILAFTPLGAEYDVAVNAIVGAKQVADASLAAGTNLTDTQKLGIAVQSATPALTAILTSKGVSTNTETHITNWIQNVYNILAGPVAQIEATVTK